MKKYKNGDRVEVAARKDGKWYPGRYIFYDSDSKSHYAQADDDRTPRNYKFCRKPQPAKQ